MTFPLHSHGVISTSMGDQFLYEIKCPCNVVVENDTPNKQRISAAGKSLAEAIEKAHRTIAGCYLWLTVDCDELPQYVREAVKNLNGFGTRMTVLKGDSCSHAPGNRLDTAFCQDVLNANTGGYVWHPLTKKLEYNVL